MESISFWTGVIVTVVFILIVALLVTLSSRVNSEVDEIEPKIIEVIVYDCSEKDTAELLKTE